jgi:hypothetical protein
MGLNIGARAVVLATVFTGMQLAVGCHWKTCLGFAIALFFGWCACEAARPWRSLLGLLTISFYVKTVLFGCVVKTLLFQPMDEGLYAPTETATVFALGFAAVWLAVLLQRWLPRPVRPLLRNPTNSWSWLVLWFSFIVLGGLGWFYGFHGHIDIVVKNEADLAAIAGRSYEVAGLFAQFFPFAAAAAVFYLAAKGEKRLISHPMVIISLLISAVPGLLEGRKSLIMIPLASAGLSLLLLRGLRYKPFWLLTAASLIILMVFVFPFVQFSRYAVQQGSLGERISTIENVAKMFLSGEDYKEMYTGAVELDATHAPYLPMAAISLERFIRYVDASRLVAATVESGKYTGFFTIGWGLRQIPPRSIYPDKPLGFINNWLSRYTGDVDQESEITQFSYGFMASLFNAFGYAGAFFGSLLLYSAMMYWMRLFTESRAGPTIWIVVIFFLFESSLVEDSAGAMMLRVWLPVTILFFGFALQSFFSSMLVGLLRLVGAVKRPRVKGRAQRPGWEGRSVPLNAIGTPPRVTDQ